MIINIYFAGLRYANPSIYFHLVLATVNQLTQIKSTYKLPSSKLKTFNCQIYSLKELPTQVKSTRICRALLCKSLKGSISFKVDVLFVVINVLGSRYHETFMNGWVSALLFMLCDFISMAKFSILLLPLVPSRREFPPFDSARAIPSRAGTFHTIHNLLNLHICCKTSFVIRDGGKLNWIKVPAKSEGFHKQKQTKLRLEFPVIWFEKRKSLWRVGDWERQNFSKTIKLFCLLPRDINQICSQKVRQTSSCVLNGEISWCLCLVTKMDLRIVLNRSEMRGELCKINICELCI